MIKGNLERSSKGSSFAGHTRGGCEEFPLWITIRWSVYFVLCLYEQHLLTWLGLKDLLPTSLTHSFDWQVDWASFDWAPYWPFHRVTWISSQHGGWLQSKQFRRPRWKYSVFVTWPRESHTSAVSYWSHRSALFSIGEHYTEAGIPEFKITGDFLGRWLLCLPSMLPPHPDPHIHTHRI